MQLLMVRMDQEQGKVKMKKNNEGLVYNKMRYDPKNKFQGNNPNDKEKEKEKALQTKGGEACR